MEGNFFMDYLGVAVVGFGTVGGGVVKVLLDRRRELQREIGVDIELRHVCDLDITTDRGVAVPKELLTTDFQKVLNDDKVGCVVHLVGGIELERKMMLESIGRRKHVVTANKALLATKGAEIFKAAAEAGVSVSFEASCAGGIPIIAALRDSFIANRIQSVIGIVNGTCNYILTSMSKKGASYHAALGEAQKKGYAEADPTLDVNGTDSAHKLVILSEIAFGKSFDYSAVYRQGIDTVEARDVQYAHELGYVIKLLAIGKARADGYELRVHPTLLSADHPLASVDGVFNGVCVRGDVVGDTAFYGRGAGRMPTASAVVSDVVDVALGRAAIAFGRVRKLPHVSEPGRIVPMGELVGRYYLRVNVVDKPGVLGKTSSVLGEHHISIFSVLQKELRPAGTVPVVMTTHEAKEADLTAAIDELERLDVVKAKTVWMRIEGNDSE